MPPSVILEGLTIIFGFTGFKVVPFLGHCFCRFNLFGLEHPVFGSGTPIRDFYFSTYLPTDAVVMVEEFFCFQRWPFLVFKKKQNFIFISWQLSFSTVCYMFFLVCIRYQCLSL